MKEMEARCPECNKLLFKVRLLDSIKFEIEIKCTRRECGIIIVWPVAVAEVKLADGR